MKLFRGKVLSFFLLIGGVFIIMGLSQSVMDLWKRRGIAAEREAELQRLILEQDALVRELEEATSSAYIERQAREKLGFVKEGETVVIMGKSQITNPNDQRKTKELDNVPSWKQWWQLFF